MKKLAIKKLKKIASDKKRARRWGRAGALAALSVPTTIALADFLKKVPEGARKSKLQEIVKSPKLIGKVIKNLPTAAVLGGSGYLLGRLAHYILEGPSYDNATFDKLAFAMMPPPTVQFSAPRSMMPNKTMMERNAMINVLGQAMSAERDPMRKRRLYELARGQLGPYAMPLREKMMIT